MLGFVLAPGEAVAPGVVLLVGGAGGLVAGVALIVLVLRMLLAQAVARDAEATQLQAELRRGHLMPIVVRIDVELARRKLGVGEFAELVGLTPANVAVLKNGRAKAVRFSTLEAMCRVLECQPGDLLEWVEEEAAR